LVYNWRELLELAEFLLGKRGEATVESKERSAASRAYYAAFGRAADYAEAQGAPLTGKGEDHSAVRRHFKDRRRTDISNKLFDLLVWREKCDYQHEVENLSDLAAQAIEHADYIFERLSK
jgi:hypothetical protein